MNRKKRNCRGSELERIVAMRENDGESEVGSVCWLHGVI